MDTHTMIWAYYSPEHLSVAATKAIRNAPTVFISAASLYEIAFKGSLGKWPEVEDIWNTDMESMFDRLGTKTLPANGLIMQRAGSMEWAHRDPFDRLIVMTALIHGLPLVSKDKTLDSLENQNLQRIW